MTSPMRRTGQLGLFTKRVRQPPPIPEFNTHCMVADVLRRWADPAWKFTHIASGELRTKATAARLKRMGVVAGWPDFILLAPTGRPHFLELKRRNAALSDDQHQFAEWCTAHGVTYGIARNFDTALDFLKAWGAVKTGVKAQ